MGRKESNQTNKSSDNREVKSMINTTRLKPYFDPEDRPTNPPPEWEDFDQPLNQEEFPDEDNIDHTDQDAMPAIQRRPSRPSQKKQTDPNIINGEKCKKAKNTARGKAPNKHDNRNSAPNQNIENQAPKQTQQPT